MWITLSIIVHDYLLLSSVSNIQPLNFTGRLWLSGLLDDIKVHQDWSFKTKITPGIHHAVYLTCALPYLRVLAWKRKVFVHSSTLYIWRSVFVNDRGRIRVRGGSWGDGNKLSPSECLECNYQFYLHILSCMLVCCDITVGNAGEDGKMVSGWPPTSISVLSTGQYCYSATLAVTFKYLTNNWWTCLHHLS